MPCDELIADEVDDACLMHRPAARRPKRARLGSPTPTARQSCISSRISGRPLLFRRLLGGAQRSPHERGHGAGGRNLRPRDHQRGHGGVPDERVSEIGAPVSAHRCRKKRHRLAQGDTLEQLPPVIIISGLSGPSPHLAAEATSRAEPKVGIGPTTYASPRRWPKWERLHIRNWPIQRRWPASFT